MQTNRAPTWRGCDAIAPPIPNMYEQRPVRQVATWVATTTGVCSSDKVMSPFHLARRAGLLACFPEHMAAAGSPSSSLFKHPAPRAAH